MAWTCERCSREFKGYHAYVRHARNPCNETILDRQRRTAQAKASGIPMQQIKRGRKNMMKAPKEG